MNQKVNTDKTQGISIMEVEEWLTEIGFKKANKTGSCIMPAPKHLRSVKQQQDTQKDTKNQKD